MSCSSCPFLCALGVTDTKWSILNSLPLKLTETKISLSRTHLFSHGGDLVSVPGQKLPDSPQLLCAVFDVPDFVVKVSAMTDENYLLTPLKEENKAKILWKWPLCMLLLSKKKTLEEKDQQQEYSMVTLHFLKLVLSVLVYSEFHSRVLILFVCHNKSTNKDQPQDLIVYVSVNAPTHKWWLPTHLAK